MSEWISVKDRLPEQDGWALTYCPAMLSLRFPENPILVQEFTRYEEGDTAWHTDEGGSVEPSHWMPLPEPPTGNDQ